MFVWCGINNRLTNMRIIRPSVRTTQVIAIKSIMSCNRTIILAGIIMIIFRIRVRVMVIVSVGVCLTVLG